MFTIGLPHSGKSTWAKQYATDNPNKKFLILGSELFSGQLRLDELSVSERRSVGPHLLLSAQMQYEILHRLAKHPRNVIVDDYNTTTAQRKKKLEAFASYGKKIAVVVVPAAEELTKRVSAARSANRNSGAPVQTVVELQAQFSLPAEGEFDEVIFAEDATKEDVETRVKAYNDEGRKALTKLRKRGFGVAFGGPQVLLARAQQHAVVRRNMVVQRARVQQIQSMQAMHHQRAIHEQRIAAQKAMEIQQQREAHRQAALQLAQQQQQVFLWAKQQQEQQQQLQQQQILQQQLQQQLQQPAALGTWAANPYLTQQTSSSNPYLSQAATLATADPWAQPQWGATQQPRYY